MFKPDDAYIVTPSCEGECVGACDWHCSQATHEPAGTVVLVHRCGEWDIGGPDDVRAMIARLQELLG